MILCCPKTVFVYQLYPRAAFPSELLSLITLGAGGSSLTEGGLSFPPQCEASCRSTPAHIRTQGLFREQNTMLNVNYIYKAGGERGDRN